MSFQEIFTNYWDSAITGLIGGLVVYILTSNNFKIFGINLNNKTKKALYAFFVAVLLVSLYSFLVYLFGK